MQEADRVMRTNYLGAYMVTQAFTPILVKEVSYSVQRQGSFSQLLVLSW
jgi:NAD(P)-dependent dehydrogenase (short-subunit alcohol dehydrogenase family)